MLSLPQTQWIAFIEQERLHHSVCPSIALKVRTILAGFA